MALLGERPEAPAYFALYRRLKLWGSNGGMPFLWGGGFMDQPYLATQALEMCSLAESEYKLMLRKNEEQELQNGSTELRVEPEQLGRIDQFTS